MINGPDAPIPAEMKIVSPRQLVSVIACGCMYAQLALGQPPWACCHALIARATWWVTSCYLRVIRIDSYKEKRSVHHDGRHWSPNRQRKVHRLNTFRSLAWRTLRYVESSQESSLHLYSRIWRRFGEAVCAVEMWTGRELVKRLRKATRGSPLLKRVPLKRVLSAKTHKSPICRKATKFRRDSGRVYGDT